MRSFLIVFTLAAVSTGGTPASAVDTTTPVPKSVLALQQCRTLTDAAARLACYDNAVDALSAATASNEVMIVERQEVRRARKGLFGFVLPKISFLSGRADNAEDREDEARLEAVVASSRAVGFELWRFTLEDGAVWETTEASRTVDEPKAGMKIVIERGSFGTFRARFGKGQPALVRRVK